MRIRSHLVLATLSLGLVLPLSSFAVEMTGAGSSFVYPILAKWADQYKTLTGHSVNYQSIGSGGGIKQIQAKTVDFGATDMPLKSEDLEKDGLVQFPIINGAIVPVINVKGVKSEDLKLTGPILADIFLGKIKKWNDKAITTANKSLKLPDQDISVVHRSDGSGTSFILTNYLSKVSPEWKDQVGEGTAVKWPVGVGGKGNEGVASYVKQIDGSIGYVEYAYALQNSMTTTQMQNKAKQFVKPGSESFAAAAAGTEWGKAKDFYLIMTDAPGAKSWPIAGSTFILMHKEPKNATQEKEALKFFQWVYSNGSKPAEELHYVPLPKSVVKLIETSWRANIKGVEVKNSL